MIKRDADWYPAVSICSGYGAGGLPVAIQLAGKPFQEVTVLRVADAFEKTRRSGIVAPASLEDLKDPAVAQHGKRHGLAILD